MPERLPRYWGSMAPPCTGIFLPCWVDAGPPPVLACADGTPSVESPWWRYRRLWEAVATSMNAVAAVDHIRAIWRPLEQQIGEQVSRLGTGASPNARRDLSEQACTAALRVLAELEDQHIGVAGSGTA